jgi:hypothetical protein
MKLATAMPLSMIVVLGASAAFAADTSVQPLTRLRQSRHALERRSQRLWSE